MAAEFQIARIPISLKNLDFFKALNPTETHLIKPFLRKGARPAEKQGFLIDLRPLRNIKRPKDFKVSPGLIKRIESLFPNPEEAAFRRTFPLFAKGLLRFYLLDNQKNRQGISTLLNDGNDYSKIIINSYSCVIFNARLRRADIVYIPVNMRRQKEELYNWPYHLNVLRLFFRLILNYQRDGIILHASSLEIDGQGYVFIGPGNSGKSTVVKALKPDRIFSDDAAVVRKIDSSYKIFPNPWWNGDEVAGIKINKHQKPAQLRAIFFIKKSENTRMRKLAYRHALAMLIYGDRYFQQVGFCDNKIGIREFYIFSQGLLNTIPAFELNIKKGARFKKDFTALINQHF